MKWLISALLALGSLSVSAKEMKCFAKANFNTKKYEEELEPDRPVTFGDYELNISKMNHGLYMSIQSISNPLIRSSTFQALRGTAKFKYLSMWVDEGDLVIVCSRRWKEEK